MERDAPRREGARNKVPGRDPAPHVRCWRQLCSRGQATEEGMGSPEWMVVPSLRSSGWGLTEM